MKQIFSSTIWSSLVVALFADIQSVNVILSSLFNVDTSIMTVLYACLIFLIVVICIFWQRDNMLYSNFIILSFALLFIYFYLLTSIFIGDPLTTFIYFSVFTISAFIIPALVYVDTRILMKAMMLYPILGVFFINDIFRIESAGNEEYISMGLSYSFLPPIIANILFINFYFKNEDKCQKTITLILTLINGLYLQKLLQFGSRGPILAIILALLFCFLQKNDCLYLRFHRKRTFILFLLVVIFIPSYITKFEFIREFLYSQFGLSFHFLDKFIVLADWGDATNGRENITDIVVSGILDKPLFGHGIDRFDANTGKLYPHNFLLQFLYDGGVFLTLMFFMPMMIKLYNKVSESRKEDLYILLLFFFVSVPGSLFSGNLWSNSLLWMFFGYAYITSTKQNDVYIDES